MYIRVCATVQRTASAAGVCCLGRLGTGPLSPAMDGLCVLLVSVLGCLVVAYVLLELHYFVRMALCVLRARLFGKRLHILEQTAFTGGFCVVYCSGGIVVC